LDLLANLNDPQRRAVQHVDGPLLVLAGAGSGKTRVITQRVAYLIQQGVAPWQVLAITFTNKAAGEMRQRVEQLRAPRGSTVCTFHSLCARLLREFADASGLAPNFSIYDRDDQLRLTKEAMARAEVPADRLTPSTVHATISNAKNELSTPAAYAEKVDGFYERNVARVFAEYEKLLAANNALDFDDLLLRMVYLLRDRPDIRAKLSGRYRYVLIDEYQDTNHAQYVLAHGIALDHENICVTGDPDQSIYAWRGADIGNIPEFEADYPNAEVVRLEENYRSTAAILGAANRLISRNTMRKDKALWTRRTGGANVRVVHCDDEHAEAREVARRIAAHRAGGGACSDVAVFYRVNSLSRVMEEALLTSGIPYRIARGVEFYNRKEIKDVLAYLRLISNPADDLSCLRIINTPARGIGATSIKRLLALGDSAGESLLGVCRRAAEAGLTTAPARKVDGFADLIASLSGDLDRPVRDICEDVVRETGLEELYSKAGEEGTSALANINELISTAAEFDKNFEGGTLSDYLQQVSLVSDLDHFDGSGGAATLMTLHAAKGLEFPVVFMVGCEDGLLPFRRGDGPRWEAPDPGKLEEERRLAFVGMTRAMDDLTLMDVRRRMVRGRYQAQIASPFLDEIGAEDVEVEDLTTAPSPQSPRGQGGGFYADVRDRARIEADFDPYEAEMDVEFPPELEHLTEGCRVHHPQFGRGKVTKIHTQPWPETRADVFFDDVGPKRLKLSKAKLELL